LRRRERRRQTGLLDSGAAWLFGWCVNVWLLIGLFVSISLLLFYLIDRAGLQRKDKLTKPEA
jgi:hypothetical protein